MSRQSSSEHGDFNSYPEPPHGLYASSSQMDMSIPTSSYMFPASMGFEQATTYADATQYVYNGQQSPGVFEEGDLQMPPSNHSTASACSSNAGSPLSHHGQIGLNPEWTQHGLGLTPGIVPSDYYSAAGTEYTSYTAPGMEDFTFEFPSTKPHGFVGELPHISRTPVQPQPNSLSSPSVSSVARDPESEAALAVDTDMPPPPTSPLSFVSPSSASFSSPVVPAWPASPRTPRVPPFFSQSSGLFTAPLECSCWFLLCPPQKASLLAPSSAR